MPQTLRSSARSAAIAAYAAVSSVAAVSLTTLPLVAQSPGESVISAMHSRWNGKTYSTLTFRQETIFPDGRMEVWWESAKVPGRLRIDIAPRDTNARLMLFRSDSFYTWRAGRTMQGRAMVHPLQLLYMDVFWLEPRESAAKLRSLGFDLTRTHDATWDGRAFTVVGAATGDTLSPQFWVEKDRMLVTRIIERGPQPTSAPRESRVVAYERADGGWTESDIRFYTGGRETQRELYTQIRANVPLDDAIFLPSTLAPPAWIPPGGGGVGVGAPAGAAASAQPRGPQSVADELLAADRAFAHAAVGNDVAGGLAAMFADEVIMPAGPGKLAKGKAEVLAAIRANPVNAGGTLEWIPVRVGVSGDGQHGFSFGTMTVRRGDGTANGAKYLAYWVRTPAGWRVSGYKRAPRPAGAEGLAAIALMPAALPSAIVAPSNDRALIESHRASVIKAERDFSDLAQKVGLGPAFKENGRADAMNMGGAIAGFVLGNEAIGISVGAGAPPGTTGSPVEWSADTAFVASSGDLGVTFGFIRRNTKNPDGTTPPDAPFFTIWWRDRPGGPWRYIAE